MFIEFLLFTEQVNMEQENVDDACLFRRKVSS